MNHDQESKSYFLPFLTWAANTFTPAAQAQIFVPLMSVVTVPGNVFRQVFLTLAIPQPINAIDVVFYQTALPTSIVRQDNNGNNVTISCTGLNEVLRIPYWRPTANGSVSTGVFMGGAELDAPGGSSILAAFTTGYYVRTSSAGVPFSGKTLEVSATCECVQVEILPSLGYGAFSNAGMLTVNSSKYPASQYHVNNFAAQDFA